MNKTETEATASDAALIAVVEQMVRDTGHGRAPRAALDSSLERDLGLDSLARVELVLRVERAFDVSLPERALYTAETPRDLLRLVHASQGVRRAEPEKGVRSLVQAEPTVAACASETLLDALAWHAARHPDRLQVHLYGEQRRRGTLLRRHSPRRRGLARAVLPRHGLQPGQAVAIMLPTGRDYLFSFFGILMAGGIPVPLYPPARPAQIEEHLRRHVGILDNCRAAMLVTIPEAKTVALLLRSQVESLQRVLMPGDLAGGDAGFTPLPANPGDIAFIQYTSGSTGNPKGVVLTHANLVANIRAMGEAVQASSSDVFVSWLPLYHDMGLIGAWFAALYHGFPTVLMSPLAFLSHPSRWLWAIHRHRGTLSGGPNFCYELCLKRIEEAELEGLDLSCWRYAFNGAEPVSPNTLAAFERRFARYGLPANALQPVYGLAEASVGLAFPAPGTHYRIDRIDRAAFQNQGVARPAAPADTDALELPGCGRVIAAHHLRVVDAAGVELADRQEGRLQFKGPSATSGYFRNPEQTRKLFDGAWLDTGDLAYLADGELYLSGRAKDVIIRGGRNLYPYELEQAVGALPGIRKGCVAVFGSIDPAQRHRARRRARGNARNRSRCPRSPAPQHQRARARPDRPAGGRHRARAAAYRVEDFQRQNPARGQPRVLRKRRQQRAAGAGVAAVRAPRAGQPRARAAAAVARALGSGAIPPGSGLFSSRSRSRPLLQPRYGAIPPGAGASAASWPMRSCACAACRWWCTGWSTSPLPARS